MTDETSHSASSAAAAAADGIDDEQVASTVRETQEALADARAQIAEVPAEVIVTNHAMGLYELAAIHLSATPPDFAAAALAIDALACLVDGLGDRIGEHAPLLRDALGNIRVAFVQLKGRGDGTAPTDA